MNRSGYLPSREMGRILFDSLRAILSLWLLEGEWYLLLRVTDAKFFPSFFGPNTFLFV